MLPSSTDAAVACPLDTLRRGRQPLTAAFLAVFIAAFAYVRYTGLIVFMGDTFLLANRAKHFADEFNLHVSHGVSPIIYPPLYSLVLSIAYLFDDPADIFKVTLALHVLLTASQVVPLFLLLRQYCHLDAKPAAAMAAVLALSPSALPYTSIALTEVLYCPVILWLVVVLSQVWIAGDRVKYLAAGTVFAVAMLTRSAATAVVLAYALTGIVLLWLYRKEAEQSKFTKRGLALSAVSFAVVFGGWCLFERIFVHYEGADAQFEVATVLGVFTDLGRLDLHASWLANCFFYFLTSPLSLAGAFPMVLFLRRPALLRRDPLAIFLLLSLFCSAAVCSLVLADSWGGRDLTFNRYVMPYVVFFFLLAIRYRAHFDRAMLAACAVVIGLAVISFKPSSLACHFIDALVLFGKQRPYPLADVLLKLGYFAITVTAGWLWLCCDKGKRFAFGLTGMLWLATHAAAANYYRNSGDLNISNYQGAAEKALSIAAAKGSEVFYDPAFDIKDPFAATRILYYWPNLRINPLPPDQLAKRAIPPRSSILYFTSDPLLGLEPLAEDRGAIRLYEITRHQATPDAPESRSFFTVNPGPRLPGTEYGDKDGRKIAVRWLGKGAGFLIDAPPGTDEINVRLTLATYGAPRTAALLVNGQPATPTYRVEGDFWGSGSLPTVATFRARVKPGPNLFEVTAAEPPAKLPDGREVLFLLIGEITAEPVSK